MGGRRIFRHGFDHDMGEHLPLFDVKVGVDKTAGIALGHFFTDAFQVVGRWELAKVNLPVAVLIWIMIIPMLLKVDLRALKGVKQHWRGVGVTLSFEMSKSCFISGVTLMDLALRSKMPPPLEISFES